MKHLKGLDFPATKQALLDHARQAQGPDTGQVIQTLQRIDDREYATPAGVLHAIDKVE